MHRIYTTEVLSNAPSIVQLVINDLKAKKATAIPQYGDVTLKMRQNSCLAAFVALSKLKPSANASGHEVSRKPIININKGKANLVVRNFIKITVRSIGEYLNLISWYFQIILFISFAATTLADTEVKFSPRSKLHAQISSDELNRIEVNGGDIMEVIGDEGKYSLYWSSDWRNLFIKPKVPTGETFELSLMFFGGLTQDIRFTAGDTTAKTIRINLGHGETSKASELTSMMRAMFEGIKGKYYVTDIKRTLATRQPLQLTQIKAYRYKDLSGAVVEVKNLSKAPVNVLEKDFRTLFKGTLAINLKTSNIAPRQKTTLFIVTREASSDR